MIRLQNVIASLCTFVLLSACQKETSDFVHADSYLELQLFNTIDGAPLRLNTNYTNAFHEDFKLTDYKYYISNVRLLNTAKDFPAPDSYYFIDEQNPAPKKFTAKVKADSYYGISFMVGVDSSKQVSRHATTTLNQGMFFGQNLGLMAAKLEGESVFSGAPNQLIRHHIGGFEGRFITLRKVVLPFQHAINLPTDKTLQVSIQAELLRWFDGLHPMQISHNPTILQPGEDAMNIADNCSKQFSLSFLQVN